MLNYIIQLLGAVAAVALIWMMWSPRVLRTTFISRRLKTLGDKDEFLASREGQYLIQSYRWGIATFSVLAILRLSPISLPISLFCAAMVGLAAFVGLFFVPMKNTTPLPPDDFSGGKS